MTPIRTEKFIQKAKLVHGETYDYSQVLYVNCNTPVKIVCSVHGPFLQRPTYHILRKSGCQQCYRDSQSHSEELFFRRAKEKFANRFTYGLYNGYRKPIEITCTKHGIFNSTPLNHLIQDGGCKQCRSEKISKPREEWIKQFNEKHDNKYDYSQVPHIRSENKMVVLCPDHGPFYPIPNNHIKGHGCPECACINYVGGYSKGYFEINPHKKDEMGISYVIRLWDDNEEFFKVGITNRSVELRFKSVLPYQYEIMSEEPMTLYEAHLKEQSTLESQTRYTPCKKFSGWTECFV